MSEVTTKCNDGFCIVQRTSDCLQDQCPCEGAERRSIARIDRRIVDDPAKVPAFIGQRDWWFKEGTNHRIENGGIARDMGSTEVWMMDVADVWDFVRKHGDCIVSINDDGFRCVEIYDDYRE